VRLSVEVILLCRLLNICRKSKLKLELTIIIILKTYLMRVYSHFFAKVNREAQGAVGLIFGVMIRSFIKKKELINC